MYNILFSFVIIVFSIISVFTSVKAEQTKENINYNKILQEQKEDLYLSKNLDALSEKELLQFVEQQVQKEKQYNTDIKKAKNDIYNRLSIKK